MVKQDIVNRVADNSGLHKQDIEEIIDLFIEAVRDTIHKGDEIEIRGLASFRIEQKDKHWKRNPQTGEPILVPAKKIVKIKPSKLLVVGD